MVHGRAATCRHDRAVGRRAAPRRGGDVVEIPHGPLRVAIPVPTAGVRPVTLPAPARRTRPFATFANGEVLTDTARQPDADRYQRAALTREGRTQMHPGAFQGDAGFGDPGHLRASAADGALRATSLTLDMPDCGAVTAVLVLQAILRETTLTAL